MRLEKICQQIGRWQPTLYRKKKRKSLERQIQAVLCSFEWWPMLPPPMNMNWAHKKMLWWPNDLRVVKVALNSNDEWQSSEVNAIWKYTVWEDDSNEQLTNCENVTYMRQGSIDLIGIYNNSIWVLSILFSYLRTFKMHVQCFGWKHDAQATNR